MSGEGEAGRRRKRCRIRAEREAEKPRPYSYKPRFGADELMTPNLHLHIVRTQKPRMCRLCLCKFPAGTEMAVIPPSWSTFDNVAFPGVSGVPKSPKQSKYVCRQCALAIDSCEVARSAGWESQGILRVVCERCAAYPTCDKIALMREKLPGEWVVSDDGVRDFIRGVECVRGWQGAYGRR